MTLLALALLALDAYAPLGEWRIHYTAAGAGEHTFVLVHGWNGSAAQWAPIVERLAGSARVIAIDLPGHGLSGAPRADYTMPLLAAAVAAVLDHAQAERAILVGHSLSVAVVREVEHRFPARVGALVLIDGTFWDGTSEAGIRRAVAANESYARALAHAATYPGTARQTVETMFTAATPPALRRLLRETLMQTPAHVAGSTMIELARSRVWTFGASRVPAVSVMAGTAGNRQMEPFIRRMFPLLRQSEFWPGAGHFLHLEQPDRFVRLLLGAVPVLTK